MTNKRRCEGGSGKDYEKRFVRKLRGYKKRRLGRHIQEDERTLQTEGYRGEGEKDHKRIHKDIRRLQESSNRITRSQLTFYKRSVSLKQEDY